jgi:hypothetical protein
VRVAPARSTTSALSLNSLQKENGRVRYREFVSASSKGNKETK